MFIQFARRTKSLLLSHRFVLMPRVNDKSRFVLQAIITHFVLFCFRKVTIEKCNKPHTFLAKETHKTKQKFSNRFTFGGTGF